LFKIDFVVLFAGHLAAAGNFRSCEQHVMCETFVLGANIVPQEARHNEDYWFRMEVLARRDLPRVVGCKVHVLSGPCFLPEERSDDPDKGLSRFRRSGPKKYLTHEVVGTGVSVPTHLFKAFVILPSDGGVPQFAAFVVPNKPIKNKPLSSFAVSREELEKAAGFQVKQALIAICGCNGFVFLADFAER
jgi:DNA/RNA endonuclease G (NUC1)